MSIQYCHYCDKKIDTDFEAEHFDCNDAFECIEEEMYEEEATLGAMDRF